MCTPKEDPLRPPWASTGNVQILFLFICDSQGDTEEWNVLEQFGGAVGIALSVGTGIPRRRDVMVLADCPGCHVGVGSAETGVSLAWERVKKRER